MEHATHDTSDCLVEQAAVTRADEIPGPVLDRVSDLFVDTVACIFAGTSADGIAALRETTLFWGGRPHATIIGAQGRTSAPFAALVNSAMGHARDFDDAHDHAVNHGCVTIVPAVLATAEACCRSADDAEPGPFARDPITGHELIAAIAVGLEVSNRLGMAFIPYLHAGWLPTTLWGPFACAAACGRLLRLTVDQMRHAFGLAYSQIHGNRQALADGTLAKRMQPAFSAFAGVQAAFLASKDITGARHIIDGAFGLPALYTGGKVDAAHITDGLGAFEQTMDISIKPYPCCRCTHAVIDAALDIRTREDVSWQDIDGGEISLTPCALAQIGKPFRIRNNATVDAQFSAAYTAALTFVRDHPVIKDFDPETIVARSEVVRLASCFECKEFRSDISSLVPAAMKITMRNGAQHEALIEAATGSPDRPMSEAAQTAKFNDCMDNAGREYSPEERAKILSTLRSVRTCADVTDLLDQI